MLGLIVFLITVGLVLVVVEWFLPSGAFGALGLFGLVAAVLLSYEQYGFEIGTAVLGGVMVASIVGTILWLKYFPRTSAGKKLMLDSQGGGRPESLDRYLNKEGEAVSPLRPAGVAQIGGERVTVVSESNHIEPGSRIRVIGVEGTKVVVRKIE